MNAFQGTNANPDGLPDSAWRERLDFGDYCWIEQYRYGALNEWYLHKVIGRLRSNAWVEVPGRYGLGYPGMENVPHPETETVVNCICCGVVETEVRKYRIEDVYPEAQTECTTPS